MGSSLSTSFVRVINWYNKNLMARPWRVSMISAALIYGSGDLLCQLLIEKKVWKEKTESGEAVSWEPDYRRTLKMSALGFFMSGPMAKVWYLHVNPWYLTKVVPRLFPAWTRNFTLWKRVGSSIFIDSFIISWPYFALMIFVTSLIGTRGDISEGITTVKEKTVPTMLAVWQYWPATQLIIYSFVPQFIRGIADNFFGTVWSSIFYCLTT